MIVTRRLILNQTLAVPKLIPTATRIVAAGTKPKIIEEFVGRVNSGDEQASIAHMRSPGGWVEPGQTPEFDEYTVVPHGQLRVTHRSGDLDYRSDVEGINKGCTRDVRGIYKGTTGSHHLTIALPSRSHHARYSLARSGVSGGCGMVLR